MLCASIIIADSALAVSDFLPTQAEDTAGEIANPGQTEKQLASYLHGE